jgi:hypothetical protein
VRDFLGVNRRNATNPENDSSKYLATEWATKDPVNGGAIINLTANQPYYIEALMKEGGGGDNLAIAIQDPGLNWDTISPQSAARASTIDLTLGNVSVRTQPLSQTVDEGTPVEFRTAPNGTPPFTYQWRRAGVNITDATNLFYSIPFASFADNGVAYSVVITGAAGAPATSVDAILTVNQDTTAPTVVVASGGSDRKSVSVGFSERVDISAATWTIGGGITVSGAALQNATTVRLTTSNQAEGQLYTLTISGVRDMAATPNTITPATVVNFNSAVFSSGLVAFERWNGGGGIAAFLTDYDAGTLGAPNVTWNTSLFESGRGLGDDYRGHGYTWFKPAETGDYVFIMTVDDNARLFLSTDDDPANKWEIAAEAQWSNNREWSNATEEQRSDSYASTTWPNFWTITLQANQTYYLEAFWQEGGGGDGVEVTFIPPSQAGTTPANGTLSALSGDLIGVYVDLSTLPPPSLMSTTPVLGHGISRDAVITWNYQGLGTTTFNTNTAQLKIDSSVVPITMTQSGGDTSISYDAAGLYDIGRGYAWELTWNDSKGAAHVDSGVFVAHFMPDSPAVADLFLVEGEDFNNDGGQVMPDVNTMPYLGGAYQDLSAIVDIDYARTDAEASGDIYRVGEVPNVPFSNDGDMVRAQDASGAATWTLNSNFRLGWAGGGRWQNYTRQVPAGDYQIWASMSYGATPGTAINLVGNLRRVTSNPTQSPQTTENIGFFRGPATGGWGANELIPLRETTAASGPAAVVTLGGTTPTTFQFEYASGDMDYFMLVAAVQVTTPTIGPITLTGGNFSIPFSGTLWSADAITGPWAQVQGATSPYSAPASGIQKYYQSQSAP